MLSTIVVDEPRQQVDQTIVFSGQSTRLSFIYRCVRFADWSPVFLADDCFCAIVYIAVKWSIRRNNIRDLIIVNLLF